MSCAVSCGRAGQARQCYDKHISKFPQLAVDTFLNMLNRSDDALVLAARAGNDVVVRILVAHKVTSRYKQAARAAKAKGSKHDLLRPEVKLQRNPTKQMLEQAKKKAVDGAECGEAAIALKALYELSFRNTFHGQLCPARPSPNQINDKVAPRRSSSGRHGRGGGGGGGGNGGSGAVVGAAGVEAEKAVPRAIFILYTLYSIKYNVPRAIAFKTRWPLGLRGALIRHAAVGARAIAGV